MNTRKYAIAATIAMLAASFVTLASVSGVAPSDPRPEASRVAAARSADEALTCRGAVTAALSADRVRICDSVTVTTRAEAACSPCKDGLNVVFLLQLEPC